MFAGRLRGVVVCVALASSGAACASCSKSTVTPSSQPRSDAGPRPRPGGEPAIDSGSNKPPPGKDASTSQDGSVPKDASARRDAATPADGGRTDAKTSMPPEDGGDGDDAIVALTAGVA